MSGRLDRLSAKQEALLPVVRDEWLAHGLSTEPADHKTAEAGVASAYWAAGLTPPPIVVWLGSPIAGAVASAMLDQVGAQVWDQVWNQVGDQVRDQVWDQARAQVWNQARAQVGAQVWAQVWNQVRDQVRAQVGDQVRDQVWDQVWAQVWDQVGNQVRNACYGNHDANWLSFFDLFGRCGIDTSRLNGIATVARSAGWWWPFRNAVILTERPSTLRRDNLNRLHCETGPALTYPDGLCDIWAWHGTRVPADLITNGWDTKRILAEPNAEVRRCAIERMGWPCFIADAGLRQVGQAVDDPGNPGQTLALYDVPESIYDAPVRVLVATNGTPERDGTRHTFGLTVPADCLTPLHAAAWTYDLDPDTYASAQVRR